MTDLQILVFSLIQGITEFIPVSSSGHLLAVGKVLGWEDQGLHIDVAVHIGTLLALIVYFFDKIMEYVDEGVDIIKQRKIEPRSALLSLIVGTIPIVIIGFLVKGFVSNEIRKDIIVYIIAINSIVFGVILWLVDKYSVDNADAKDGSLTLKQSVYMGFLQVLALIPGVSRSGICIIGGRWFGLSRVASAERAMLMGIPVLLGAGLLIGYDLYTQADFIIMVQFVLAIIFSFCSALFVIYFLMRWFKRSTMLVFALYRIVFGVFLLYVFYV